jgi:cytokinesis protein
MLTFLCFYENNAALDHVLSSLDALSAANNMTGRYEYWFKAFEGTLEGRGKMGSLVGASDAVRKMGGVESSLNDYAVSLFVS